MKKIIFAIITGLLFLAEIALLKTYDVAPVGAGGTDVGFSAINVKFHEMTGVNLVWYEITNYIGYFAIGVCGIFAVTGLVQLIKRKSLFKVDREIISLGGLFIIVMACYVLFEKVVINYRPVLMPGSSEPEASFPSSHTLLGITVMIATAIIIGRYVKNETFAAFIRFLCVVVAIVCVGGRLWSGVHWLTDIIGGVLLSITLLLIFSAVIGDREKEMFSQGDRSAGRAQPRERSKYSTAGYIPKH